MYYLLILLLLCSCTSNRIGCAIPGYLDEYVLTTKERAFELTHKLDGRLVKFQKAYPCTSDSIMYCAVSIIEIDLGDTISVYSPCLDTELKEGSLVTVDIIHVNEGVYLSTREIYIQFPRKSPHYPLWLCVSCRYPNTVGIVNAR